MTSQGSRPYLNLNRPEEAQATAEEAQAKNVDSAPLHFSLYQLGSCKNDAAGMAQQVAWAAGKPRVEDLLLAGEGDTAAYSGRLGKARESSRPAVASAERPEEKETAAGYEAEAALREALFGNATEARQRAAAALALSNGRDVPFSASPAPTPCKGTPPRPAPPTMISSRCGKTRTPTSQFCAKPRPNTRS